jgi:hypothetical protein
MAAPASRSTRLAERNGSARPHVLCAVFTIGHARGRRALLAALAIGAFTFGALPLASPAAPAKATATTAAKTAAKSAASKSTATKAVAKKAAQRTGYHPHNGPAPADEYFGRLQMSILGVRSKVRDLGLDADIHPEHDKTILGNALWVEDAMRDWAKKYPFDRWLPRYAYALEQMYERIPGGDAHKRALKQISYLTAYFPQTVYGKIGRAKLAQGVPEPDPSATPPIASDLERLALLDGKVIPTLPPAPTPTPSPSPAVTPTASPSPADTPGATATPAPAASARP